MNSGLYLWAEVVNRVAELIGELHAQPVTRSQAEIGAKMKIGLGSDPALLVYDFIDPLMR